MPTSVGTHTLYFSNVASNTLNIARVGGVTNIKIDNVSVREVGQDWVLSGLTTIGNDVVSFVDNGTNTNSNIIQDNVVSANTTYKLTFDIVRYSLGALQISVGNSLYIDDNLSQGVGTYTLYVTSGSGSRIELKRNGAVPNFDFDITNISVKEVGQNWDLLNDVTSFSFNNGIANIQGTANSANNGIKQASISAVIGKTYKISATLRSNDGGLYRFRLLDGSYFDLGSGNSAEFETITSYHTATSTAFTIFATSWYTSGTANFDISNISIIEITDDTNLPRINYEGFSYQDALGSELVTNGGFDDGLNGWSPHAGSTLELENGMAKVTTAGGSGFIKRTDLSIETGKTYFCKAYITNGLSPQWFINSVNNPINLSLISENTYGGYVTTNGNNPFFYIRGNNTDGEVSYIDNVSVKEYLGQEVVPDSGCGSWLFEPQSTNLLPYSSDFSQWSKVNYTVQSNVAVSPSGNFDASFVTNPSGGGGLINQTINVTSSTAYTFSFYAKRGTASDAKYSVYDYTNGGDIIPPTSYYSQINSDTFTRITVSFTAPVGCTSLAVYVLRDNSAVGNTIVWGAQVEALSYPTSYIPTDGSTVTRNQDVCNNGGSLASINSTEGVLYAEISTLNGDSGSNRTISLSDSTNGNQIRFYFPINIEGQIKIRVDVGGSTIYIFDYNIATSETPIKLAFRYSPNGMDFYGNGSLVSSSALAPSFTNNLNSLQFRRGDGQFGEDFFGKTKALAVWKEALSDAELTESNNNIMNIYKTNFPTEQEGKDYLLSIGVLVETDNEIVFSKDTAAVVYIGKVVKIPATYDADGNIITPAVYYDGYAIDVMSSLDLDFGGFMVYPIEAAHSFYGYPRNAEVPK